MTRSVEVEAPAKVNLLLRVRERRPDGFHELETLFQSISLSDRVVVGLERGYGKRGGRLGDQGSARERMRSAPAPVYLTIEGPDVGPIGSNLAYRAARRFVEATGTRAPVRIHLEKRIPAGAGLGGGSSDAAAVLRALAALTDFDDGKALHDMAADLGSDVPFFLADSPLALGRGRGERLTEFEPLPETHLVVALPEVHVDTGEAYAALAETRGTDVGERSGGVAPSPAARRPVGRPEPVGRPSSWEDVQALAANDFEPIVAPLHDEIRASLDGLRAEGASVALLSGSGAACFGLFDGRHDADEAAGKLGLRHPWRFVVATTRTDMPPARELG